MHPQQLAKVPLPILAEALGAEGFVMDVVTPERLRCRIPPRNVGDPFSVVNWMRQGDLVVERVRDRLMIWTIPAFSRLCVGAAGAGITAFLFYPGPLVDRLSAAFWVGA